jgi:hypothetical protein
MLTRRTFLRMRNISDKSCTENQNTFHVQQPFPPRKSCRLWDRSNVETCSQRGSRQYGACARKHTQKCAILIAFPLQQWLRERASMLRYTYIACLVTTQASYISNSNVYALPAKTAYITMEFGGVGETSYFVLLPWWNTIHITVSPSVTHPLFIHINPLAGFVSHEGMSQPNICRNIQQAGIQKRLNRKWTTQLGRCTVRAKWSLDHIMVAAVCPVHN